MDYFLARYYSSTQGRFTSPDEFQGGPRELFVLGCGSPTKQALPYAEITNPQSLNKYVYTYNNPLRYIDLDGHMPDGDEDGLWESIKKYIGSLFKSQVEWKTGEEEREQKYPNPGGIPDGDKIVESHFSALTTTNSALSNVIVLADPTGASGTVKSYMQGDKTGVAIGMVGIVSGLSKLGVTFNEAKGLVGAWGKGTFDTSAKLIKHSFEEHGASVGAKNVWQFMRKAAGFNTRGASREVYDNGNRIRYVRKDGTYIIKDAEGKIISYGRN